MKLRDYQDYATSSIFEYFSNQNGNPLVVMPTGTGKSLVIADFCKRALIKYRGTRIMLLTHVKELIEQDFDKLIKVWPTAPAGIYSSGLKRKDTFYPITFGGVASVVKVKDFNIFGKIDLLLIDEGHLVSSKDESSYGKIITALKSINPYLKVVGFTATDFRLGHGRLTEEKHIFTDICVDMSKRESFNWFIEQGYLVPLIPRKPNLEVDVSNIKMRGGEYVDAEAQAAVDKQEITYAACKEMIQLGAGRHKWLIFSSGIEHAQHISQMLDSLDINNTFVHSKMTELERDKRIANFKAGKYQAIVNNGILTTGFDDAEIDMIGMLRLTQSPGLWVQMLGRGTRPFYANGYDLNTKQGRLDSILHSQKQNCLVLDFAGNTKRLGPVNDPVIPRPKSKIKGEAPIKICDACMCYNHTSARFCFNCGQEFSKHLNIKQQSSTDELIAANSQQPVTTVFNVDKITYQHHFKEGKPSSMKVTYYAGLRRFSEYICLEHLGYPAKKAQDWWRAARGSPNEKAPVTTSEAMREIDVLRKPKRIKVWINKDNPEILDYEY